MLETALSTACSAICKTRGLTLSWSSRSCWSVKNSRQMRSVCAHSRDLKMSRKAARSLLPTSSVAALTCRHLDSTQSFLEIKMTKLFSICKVALSLALLRIRIYVFGSGSVSMRFRSGSGIPHQAKIVRKSWFLMFCDFFRLFLFEKRCKCALKK